MIRAVIIGFAHMHVNEIAQYILSQPDTELVGIADAEPKFPEETEKRYTRAWNLKNVAELTNAKVFSDYKKLLDGTKPDFAYILCENFKKPEIALECAKRGVNIVVEKPMAADLSGADLIASLPEKYGVEVAVNWPVAWRPYLHRFKQAADERICGEPVRLRYLNGHTGPLGKGAKHRGVSESADDMTDGERSRIWWYNSDCGGGAFLDILCYGCWFARWLFGVPLGVTALGANLATPYADCEDNTAALFRYDGKIAVAEGSWTIPRVIVPAGPQLLCTDGALVCSGGADSGQRAEAYSLSGEPIELPEPELPDSMRNMPWHIAAHILDGKPLFEPLTAEFNLDVMRMLDAAVRSNAERHEVQP